MPRAASFRRSSRPGAVGRTPAGLGAQWRHARVASVPGRHSAGKPGCAVIDHCSAAGKGNRPTASVPSSRSATLCTHRPAHAFGLKLLGRRTTANRRPSMPNASRRSPRTLKGRKDLACTGTIFVTHDKNANCPRARVRQFSACNLCFDAGRNQSNAQAVSLSNTRRAKDLDHGGRQVGRRRECASVKLTQDQTPRPGTSGQTARSTRAEALNHCTTDARMALLPSLFRADSAPDRPSATPEIPLSRERSADRLGHLVELPKVARRTQITCGHIKCVSTTTTRRCVSFSSG
jgi:hypothetical protein